MFRINAEIFSNYLFRFIFSIANPLSDKGFSSSTILYKNGRTPIEDVSWEFQVIRDRANLFLFNFEAKNKGDHPGIYFEGAFIWWNVTLEIYDINHYDDCEDEDDAEEAEEVEGERKYNIDDVVTIINGDSKTSEPITRIHNSSVVSYELGERSGNAPTKILFFGNYKWGLSTYNSETGTWDYSNLKFAQDHYSFEIENKTN